MKILEQIFKMPRFYKRGVSIFADTLFIVLAFSTALLVRYDNVPLQNTQEYLLIILFLMPTTIFAFIRLGLYRAVLRYVGTHALMTAAIGCALSTLALVLVSFFTYYDVPRSVPIMYGLILFGLVAGSRIGVRTIANSPNKLGKEPVIIYGAGSSGRQLALSLMIGNEYKPVAFIDDDEHIQNTVIMGRPVHGPDKLLELVKSKKIQRVLLALPQETRAVRSAILKRLEILQVSVLTIPGSADLVSGAAKIDELQDVAIEDLLGRESVDPKQNLMAVNITDKVVMVTGAGGSIGSELCRQIIKLKPKRLVLYELSEYALYKIDNELLKAIQATDYSVDIKPIIGTVQRQNRIETVMKQFGVQTVYHAAAYKHVPLVEHNVVEGVRNNVFGTYFAAQAAINAGVETFVLISTDKAVRPTNVMGASKRLAELTLQGLASHTKSTVFCMVRFGNVLGSSGSVVPLFREQIKKGGPVTVTDKDIIRYFMTIPEAAQLVIQAAAMANAGDVYVLDMGDPVKITDLAEKMIHLMGLTVKDENHINGDIEIQYTGLRPGEKLYEELLIGDNVKATGHERIMAANENYLPWPEMKALLDELDAACHNFEIEKIKRLLLESPTGYQPSSELCDLVWLQTGTLAKDSKVIKLRDAQS